jgi:hypothetical protein
LTRVRSLPDALGHKTPSKSLPGAWWGILNKCHKYDKDGNPVAAAAGKPSDAKKPFKKEGNKQMAYLTATIKSRVKTGLKKAAKSEKKKCRSYDTSSTDSDLE